MLNFNEQSWVSKSFSLNQISASNEYYAALTYFEAFKALKNKDYTNASFLFNKALWQNPELRNSSDINYFLSIIEIITLNDTTINFSNNIHFINFVDYSSSIIPKSFCLEISDKLGVNYKKLIDKKILDSNIIPNWHPLINQSPKLKKNGNIVGFFPNNSKTIESYFKFNMFLDSLDSNSINGNSELELFCRIPVINNNFRLSTNIKSNSKNFYFSVFPQYNLFLSNNYFSSINAGIKLNLNKIENIERFNLSIKPNIRAAYYLRASIPIFLEAEYPIYFSDKVIKKEEILEAFRVGTGYLPWNNGEILVTVAWNSLSISFNYSNLYFSTDFLRKKFSVAWQHNLL